MEIMNSEIFNAFNSFNTLFSMELPVRTSMAIAKLSTKLGDSFRAIDKVRNGLITKHGRSDVKTNQVGINPEDENWPKFVEELNELMEQKTEVIFERVRLPQEIDGKPLMLKPSLLIQLDKFVELEVLKSVK